MADEVLRLRGEPGADLGGIDVVVPGWAHAPLLRSALHARLAAAGSPRWIPPRIVTLAAWAGEPEGDRVERRVELFAALRGNAWVRESFGDQPAALWNLAAHVAAACDELTLAAIGDAASLEARLQSALARHFHRRAAQALLPQAQLVLRLWRASLDDARGAQATLGALRERAAAARRPLVYVAGARVPAWTQTWLAAMAARVPVGGVQVDVRVTAEALPLVAAAWPELATPHAAPAPIADRARRLHRDTLAAAPVLVETKGFEDQAIAVCEQVLDWLRPPGQADLFAERPPASIALVALDRLVARRVRALLERAQVLVRDELGWKLSTTSAAGVVMRLLDLGANGFHHRDLLDWLKSPFTLGGAPQKAYLVEVVERVIRGRGIVAGLGALQLALGETRAGSDTPDESRVAAAQWLRTLETHATRLAGRASTLGGFAQSLAVALDELGMRGVLARDPVGVEVLRVLDDLRTCLAADTALGGLPASALEFRALLASRFEEEAVPTGAVDSPVVMVSLAGAVLRDFDAAMLIGADAAHLPALPPELLFFSEAVRTDLGLEGRREAVADQAAHLALLLARVPRVAVTWCSVVDDEPRALAPWFARLRAVAAAAGRDPLREFVPRSLSFDFAPTRHPEPPAPHMPASLSASRYQSLVDCPYQFHARHLLRLRELEEVLDEPDAREYGLAVHDVLAQFHEHWRDAGRDDPARDLARVPAETLAASLTEIADRVFKPLIERRPRLIALRQQFARTQVEYLAWLGRRLAEGWRFEGAEVEAAAQLDVGAGLPPVQLRGRLDRIDVRGDEVEVLDYKTRRKQELDDDIRLAGENVQLAFYGLIAPRPATRAAFLYLQRTSDNADAVGTVAARQPYAALRDALRERLKGDLARLAARAPLPALGNEVVCERCEMRGLCRRDFWADGEAPR